MSNFTHRVAAFPICNKIRRIWQAQHDSPIESTANVTDLVFDHGWREEYSKSDRATQFAVLIAIEAQSIIKNKTFTDAVRVTMFILWRSEVHV